MRVVRNLVPRTIFLKKVKSDKMLLEEKDALWSVLGSAISGVNSSEIEQRTEHS